MEKKGFSKPKEGSDMKKLKAELNKEVILATGIVPSMLANLESTLETTHDLLHHYVEHYATDLPEERQRELSQLYVQSNILTLELNELFFDVDSVQCEAERALALGKKLSLADRERASIQEQMKGLTGQILGLNKKTLALVKSVSVMGKE